MAYASRTQLAQLGLAAAALASVSDDDQDAALEAASGLADSYLQRAGITVPMSSPYPGALVLHVCKLAGWIVLSARGFDPSDPSDKSVRAGYEDAVAWLEKAAMGKVSLQPYDPVLTVSSDASTGRGY